MANITNLHEKTEIELKKELVEIAANKFEEAQAEGLKDGEMITVDEHISFTLDSLPAIPTWYLDGKPAPASEIIYHLYNERVKKLESSNINPNILEGLKTGSVSLAVAEFSDFLESMNESDINRMSGYEDGLEFEEDTTGKPIEKLPREDNDMEDEMQGMFPDAENQIEFQEHYWGLLSPLRKLGTIHTYDWFGVAGILQAWVEEALVESDEPESVKYVTIEIPRSQTKSERTETIELKLLNDIGDSIKLEF